MANEGWYRYVSAVEKTSIERDLTIKSASGTTWYALQRLTDWSDVQEILALEDPRRDHRVGPLYGDELPAFDVVPQRTVQPQKLKSGKWVSGGGTEAATGMAHFIYGSVDVR